MRPAIIPKNIKTTLKPRMNEIAFTKVRAFRVLLEMLLSPLSFLPVIKAIKLGISGKVQGMKKLAVPAMNDETIRFRSIKMKNYQ